jgi:hypothetical protein
VCRRGSVANRDVDGAEPLAANGSTRARTIEQPVEIRELELLARGELDLAFLHRLTTLNVALSRGSRGAALTHTLSPSPVAVGEHP